MAAERVPFVSADEYLERERKAESKSEYHAGALFAMAGASEAHNTINYNLAIALNAARQGGRCRIFQNDMRVAIDNGIRFVYPDTVVVCGERRFYDREPDTLINPTLVIEILSPTTESYDRGLKFRYYQRIASVQEYVLVSQIPCGVEVYRRDTNTLNGSEWRYTSVEDCTASVVLGSLGLTIPIVAIYEGISVDDSDGLPTTQLP